MLRKIRRNLLLFLILISCPAAVSSVYAEGIFLPEETAVTEPAFPAEESVVMEDTFPADETAIMDGNVPAEETALPEETAVTEPAFPAEESAVTETPAHDYVQNYGWTEPWEVPVHEDFLDLFRRNADLVGWLTAGDSISYPVVQFDNDFYLHHDFDGNDSIDGTLFVHETNLLWPRDWLVIIHGHHMRSGSMFGRLQAYESYSYLCRYPIVIFRTVCDPEDVYYVPVAGFNASMNEDDPSYFSVFDPWYFYWEEVVRLAPQEEETELPEEIEDADETLEDEDSTEAESIEECTEEEVPYFPDEETLKSIDVQVLNADIDARKVQYLTAILDRSLWITPVPISTGDSFLMLSTCSYYQENGRFMLLCRRLRDDETPQSICALFQG